MKWVIVAELKVLSKMIAEMIRSSMAVLCLQKKSNTKMLTSLTLQIQFLDLTQSSCFTAF